MRTELPSCALMLACLEINRYRACSASRKISLFLHG